jgi:Holliday junction resolvase RusA-like endonuclease
MSFRVAIALDGPPRGKGRPRTTVTKNGHAHIYTDDKTVKYESQLRYAAMQEMAGRPPTAQPVALLMTVRFAIPTSWSRKKRAAAQLGHVRPTVKPDADNTLKLTDALNGIVWLDDKQVVDARVRKVYAETPGLLIEIKTIAAPILPAIAADIERPRELADLFTGRGAAT